jgi:hypothetical protein
MTAKKVGKRILLRLPPTDAAQVMAWADENWTSMNAEIIRSIRERHERERAEQAAA